VEYRHHWHEPPFWRWWWQSQVPIEGKIVVGLVTLALLAGGGYAAVSALPAGAAGGGNSDVRTIVRTYTIHGSRRVKQSIVVRRVTTPGRVVRSTAYKTRTVHVAAPARSVTIVHSVPHYKTRVETVAGRIRTTTIISRRTTPARTVTTAAVSTQIVTNTVPTTVMATTTVKVDRTRTATATTTVPTTITVDNARTVTVRTTVPLTITVTTTVPRNTTQP
jgi:hypothetical protein